MPKTKTQSTNNQLTTNPKRSIIKVNLLNALYLKTNQMIRLKPESYLQARTELSQTLKLCQKLLEQHEENTFIPLLEKEQTDTLRFGRYEVTYKPSKKTVIDREKLEAALPKPEQISLFFKQPEFKTLPESRCLLLKLGIFSDVYSIKEGKKPILNITDTNTIKRKLEEEQETEEEVEAEQQAGEEV